MKQQSGKTIRSLVVGLVAAAIVAPAAQAGLQARSERSQVARPAASYYTSPAFCAELVRVGAMNGSSSKHPSTSNVARPAASYYSSQAYHALMVRSAAMNAFYSKHPSTSVARPDDRAGVHGTGPIETPQVVTTSGDGFDWGDASIGGGVALAALIVLTGGVALSRRNRTAPLAV